MDIRKRILKGYLPDYQVAKHVKYHLLSNQTNCIEIEKDELIRKINFGESRNFSFIIPTYVGRCGLDDHLIAIDDILSQFKTQFWINEKIGIFIFVCMQWHQQDDHEALYRIRHILINSAISNKKIKLIGVTLAADRKMISLNVCFELCTNIPIYGIGWLDDDVTLEKYCLVNLVKQFILNGGKGAVGATKVGHANKHRAAKLLKVMKNITKPAMNYPHGCCILVDPLLVKNGIPLNFSSDDGFICFECIDPHQKNPMHLLTLVPDAVCHHVVGGPPRQIIKRIRRILLNHHILLSSYPRQVSNYYFHQCLFFGMWPIVSFDKSIPIRKGIIKLVFKWFYFLLYLSVGTELYFRGLFNIPLKQIPWAGLEEYSAPSRHQPQNI